jgi:hypothetical protein
MPRPRSLCEFDGAAAVERRLVTGFAIGHDIADDYLGPQQGRTVVRLKAFFETLLAAPPTAVAMAPACESPQRAKSIAGWSLAPMMQFESWSGFLRSQL